MEKSLDLYRPCMKKCSHGMHDDRISSLPVEILLIILSLLPLNEMVKTSILSRRWLKLWVNTPVLDLKSTTRFNYIKWVNHVLPQHKGCYLKQFRICGFLMNDCRKDIDGWLAFALARKVEILELNVFLPFFTKKRKKVFLSSDCVNEDDNYIFPVSWFISSGSTNMDGGMSRVPQSNLKFLKSLILKYVNVTNEAIHSLLRNCPILERLELVENQLLADLVISDPTLVLKHLMVKRCLGLMVLSISNFNLVSLVAQVEILILQDLPMLVELFICGFVHDLRRTLSQSATGICQLKSLELIVLELQNFSKMPSVLAQMTKLKRLFIHYFANAEESLIVLLNLIKSCNYLEEFLLELMWSSPKRERRALSKAERLTFESLKVFEFKGFYGRFSDFELILHVVNNAPSLEKIIIDTSDIVFCSLNRPKNSTEREAMRITLKQIKYLKEEKYIPPQIDVLIG